MSTKPPNAVRTPRATPRYFFTGSSRSATDPVLGSAQLPAGHRQLMEEPRVGALVAPYDRDPHARQHVAGVGQRGRHVVIGDRVSGHRLLGTELAGHLTGVRLGVQ